MFRRLQLVVLAVQGKTGFGVLIEEVPLTGERQSSGNRQNWLLILVSVALLTLHGACTKTITETRRKLPLLPSAAKTTSCTGLNICRGIVLTLKSDQKAFLQSSR